MKVGDKYVCIKSRGDLNLKDNIYTILKIDTDVQISIEKSIYHLSAHYHYLDNNSNDYYIFNEYFTSIREERKNKLRKINESL